MYASEIYAAVNPSSWGILIPLYLILIGISSGCMIVAAGSAMMRKASGGNTFRILVAAAAACIILAPVALVFDLAQPARFLYVISPANFNPRSAMSWGSLILVLHAVLTLAAFVLLFFGKRAENQGGDARLSFPLPRPLLGMCLVSGILLALYPGFELGVARENPLLSSDLLPLVFLASSVLAGLAIAWVAEATTTSRVEASGAGPNWTAGVVVSATAVLALLVAWSLSSLVANEPDAVLAAWSYSPFSIVAVGLGLVVPLILAAVDGRVKGSVPAVVANAMALIGCFAIRFAIVFMAFPA